jgi:hypothetical protein
MARPHKTAATVRVDIVLTLTAGIDDDLIELFAKLARRQRPQLVKAALRGQVQVEAPTPDENDTDFLADLGL